jgi:uroporphyrin-III C-methyltransferase
MSEPERAQGEQAAPRLEPVRPRGRWAGIAALLFAAAAAGFSAWQWHEARNARSQLERDVARKLSEVETNSVQARNFSTEARSAVRDAEVRLGQLESRIIETQNQRFALEALYQELSRSRDEWVLAEVEQILLLASQQLQLAGNVKAALVALETADARLGRTDRPQLIQLRRVIGQDIERLKAAPSADVTGMGLKLERVLEKIDSLPLANEARANAQNAAPAQPQAAGWSSFWQELKKDLKELVRIQRIDSQEPMLLAPEQTFFLRENLKLRLLGARLALLSRDGVSFKSDVAAAIAWIKRYFDPAAQPVGAAVDALEQLSRTEIGAQPPSINASLDAVRNFRLVRERGVR